MSKISKRWVENWTDPRVFAVALLGGSILFAAWGLAGASVLAALVGSALFGGGTFLVAPLVVRPWTDAKRGVNWGAAILASYALIVLSFGLLVFVRR